MIIAIVLLLFSLFLFCLGWKLYLADGASSISKLTGLALILVLPVDVLHQNILLPALNWPIGYHWLSANLVRIVVPYLPTVVLLLFIRVFVARDRTRVK